MKHFLALLVGVSLVLGGSVSQVWGGVESRVFNEIAEHLLRNTQVGGSIINRISGLKAIQVTEESYSSFMARIKWKRNQALRSEIQGEMAKIEAQLEKYRIDQGRPAKLEAGKPLPTDELKFLDEASASLRSQSIEDLLLIEEHNFVKAYLGPHSKVEGSGSYHANEEAFITGAVDDVARAEMEAAMFDPKTGADLRELELSKLEKLAIYFKASGRFLNAALLSEGDFRNIFIRSGKSPTLNDLETIRKYVRLFDGINDYSHLRFTVRAFANEPSAVYTRLTELTAEATAEYAKGFMSIDSYISAVQAVGVNAKLPLNNVVYETQKRILAVIERCNTLGGKLNGAELGEGEVARAERGVVEAEDQLRSVEAQLLTDAAAKDSRALLRHRADRDLARQRLDLAARILEDKSFEFVRNRDLVEIFGNLREGKINWESVQRFDMADPFFVDQARIDAWAPLYERSLARSMNLQIKHEISVAIKAQIGGTRKAVRSLNKLTAQVTGRMFTETTTGKGLQTYAKHQFAAHLIRLGKLMGVTIPIALADEISGHQLTKFFKSLITDEAAGGATPVRPATGTGLPPVVHPRANPNPSPNPIINLGL